MPVLGNDISIEALKTSYLMLKKNVLASGLKFALPPLKLNYGDYLRPFELLFRDLRKLPVSNNISGRAKG